MKRPLLIAEVKTQSPFGFKSKRSWKYLFDLANERGDMISIHTSPTWGGSFDLLWMARQMTDKPILAKGIHRRKADISGAVKIGADHVLTLFDGNALMSDHPQNVVWYEPPTTRGLSWATEGLSIVWNQRDLFTGKPKKERFEQVRELHKGWLCQASMIKTKKDVDMSADAILVGEHLETFIKTW